MFNDQPIRYRTILLAVFVVSTALGAIHLGADQVSGTVVNQLGPVEGARVRVQAELDPNFVLTDAQGNFTLETPPGSVIVCAGKELNTVGSVETTGGSSGVEIVLEALRYLDHFDYEYIDPRPGSSSWACSQCHNRFYDQWIDSTMATSVNNPYVLSYYNGTDIFGNPAGFGYRLEHPDSYGDCAGCHAPAMTSTTVVTGGEEWDLNAAVGDIMNGIHCDWCHKVSEVIVSDNPPYLHEKFFMRRAVNPIPHGGAGPMIGPLDDISYEWMGATYSAAMQDSSFCALCHLDSNHAGVPSEQTYDEWLNSSYPAKGEGCPECHMEPLGDTAFSIGGVERDPSQVHNHFFHGRTEEDLTNAVTMTVDSVREAGQVVVTVNIENDLTGHSVPSGFPTRNLVLLVQVEDHTGSPLTSVPGSTEYLPDWAGVGDPNNGNFAGLPGRGFAKILADDMGNAPVFYTEAVTLVSDNRIVAGDTDTSVYTFVDRGQPAGSVSVDVQLLYRRTWKADMDIKQWDTPDVVMESSLVVLPPAESVTVETSVVGPTELERGDVLDFRVVVTNLLDTPVTAATRAEVDAPGIFSLTRGPVDIALGPLEVHDKVYHLEINPFAPFGDYLMEVISEVGGVEADRDSLTYEVIPGGGE